MLEKIWEKKKFFDLWSIPHLIFGSLFAFTPFLFDVSINLSFFIMITLALLWEVYEKIIDIRETVWNILIDILLPIIAFFVTHKVLLFYNVDVERAKIFFSGLLFIYLFTNVSGWLAFRRRKRDFMN
jgi:hypothetical protein